MNTLRIKDDNFRAYLKKTIPEAFDGDWLNIDHPSVKNLEGMRVVNKGISSLEGIEYFTNLKFLCCMDNQLTTLDVSHNTALTELNFSDNQLTTLDLRNNTYLTTLICESNNLTTLDVSHNTAVTTLVCCDNKLKTVNVIQNTVLDFLYCDKNVEVIKANSNYGLYHINTRLPRFVIYRK